MYWIVSILDSLPSSRIYSAAYVSPSWRAGRFSISGTATRLNEKRTYGIEDGFGLFATGGGYSLHEFDILGFEQSGPLVALFSRLCAMSGRGGRAMTMRGSVQVQVKGIAPG